MKENENINALDELNKGASMGKDAIKFVLPCCSDKKFKKELEEECEGYSAISKKANKLYKNYKTDDEITKPSLASKVMTWYGIKIKTLTDTSNSKIAELMLQGTNMGIIEGRKILNNKNIDKEIHKLMQEFVVMQEKNVETLKTYL